MADAVLVADGVELMHHLRQPPGADARQENVEEEELERRAAERINQRRVDLTQLRNNRGESADLGTGGERDDHDDNAADHDEALDEVGHRGGDVAAERQADGGQQRDKRHADPVRRAGEDGGEEHAEALVDGRGIGNEEDEDDARGEELHAAVFITAGEEFGHRARLEVVRHLTGADGEELPGHQAADQRVADADPHGRKADVPAVHTRVTNKNNGREIGGSVGKSGEPRAYFSAAEQEVIDGAGTARAVDADADHANGKNGQSDASDGGSHCVFQSFRSTK